MFFSGVQLHWPEADCSYRASNQNVGNDKFFTKWSCQEAIRNLSSLFSYKTACWHSMLWSWYVIRIDHNMNRLFPFLWGKGEERGREGRVYMYPCTFTAYGSTYATVCGHVLGVLRSHNIIVFPTAWALAPVLFLCRVDIRIVNLLHLPCCSEDEAVYKIAENIAKSTTKTYPKHFCLYILS